MALPLLQRRFAPLTAGLILGSFWGLWHAPAFLHSGTPQSAWSFGPYVIGVLALGVIVKPMFNAARGSILIAALFHVQVNGPAWPDAQPRGHSMILRGTAKRAAALPCQLPSTPPTVA